MKEKEALACELKPKGNPRKKGMSRRSFLGLLWWGAAGILALEAVAASLLSLWPRTKAGAFGAKITAGKVEDFPLASITYLPEGRLYISHVQTSTGKTGLLALYRKCTHLGCVVPWRPEEHPEDDLAEKGRFNCPCHASIFNRYGEVKGGPAPRPLDLFPITIEQGEVMVDTGKIIQRSNFEDSQVALL